MPLVVRSQGKQLYQARRFLEPPPVLLDGPGPHREPKAADQPEAIRLWHPASRGASRFILDRSRSPKVRRSVQHPPVWRRGIALVAHTPAFTLLNACK